MNDDESAGKHFINWSLDELFEMHLTTKIFSFFFILVIRKWLTWKSRWDAVHLSTAAEFHNTLNRTTIFLKHHHSVGSWGRQRAVMVKTKPMKRNLPSPTMKTHRPTTTTWKSPKPQSYHNHQKTTVELLRYRLSRDGQWGRTKRMTSFWKSWWVDSTQPTTRLTNFSSFLQHFPFANQSPIGDLAKFYRECFNAPPLESFGLEIEPTFDQVETEMAVDDLTRQLAEFETSLNEFDGLITSLCESENQCAS